MSFNAESFCLDFNIEYWTTGKNVSPGWISFQCPFCDDHSNHGAFEIETGRFSCFRCGTHWNIKTISNLTNTSISKAKKLFKKYSSDHIYMPKEESLDHIYISKITYPGDTGPLNKKAKQYLLNRNFDPDYLAKEWGLLSTGNTGEYKYCILTPIYLNGRLISYQCRDITGKAKTPYRPCHIDQSVYNFEYSLYGIDKAVSRLDKNNKKKCIVVEGITDVWRLGPGAVATFGINFTSKQVLLLKKTFDEINILFDAEDQAQEQGEKLYHQLRGYNIETNIFTLDHGDPGELSDSEAKKIKGEIL